MSDHSTIIDPKDLLAEGITRFEYELAEIFVEIGMAESLLQGQYFAVVHSTIRDEAQFCAAIVAGRLGGPDLEPVDMASGEFRANLKTMRNITFLLAPAQGHA